MLVQKIDEYSITSYSKSVRALKKYFLMNHEKKGKYSKSKYYQNKIVNYCNQINEHYKKHIEGNVK